MTNYAAFESFYYDFKIFLGYILCFVIKLAFYFIWLRFLTLYLSRSDFSVKYQFYGFTLDLCLYFKHAC